METDQEREMGLAQVSTAQQHQRLGTESEEVSLQTNKGIHFTQLDQHHVQAKMSEFHKEMSTINTPTCTICMEKFPGLKVNSYSQCQ